LYQVQHVRTFDQACRAVEVFPGFQVEDLDRTIVLGRHKQSVFLDIYREMIEIAAGNRRQRDALDLLKRRRRRDGIQTETGG